MTATPPLVLVIAASVRAQRLGPRIAAWVTAIGHRDRRFACLAPARTGRRWPTGRCRWTMKPAFRHWASMRAHTRAWSAKIASADAFVFVTPQYNWGYPASLKNALDHLHGEWRGKPAAIVSYGGHGGGKCATQLAQVLQALKMRLVPTMPGLELSEAAIRHAELDPARDLAAHRATVVQAFDELAALFA